MGFFTVEFEQQRAEAEREKQNTRGVDVDYSPLKRVTTKSFLMGVLVSMGGMVFGYDTGQISGFLQMPDFLRRFGMYNHHHQQYEFTNVRSGLIVGLLSIGTLFGALIAAPVADRIGRKPSISFWALVASVGFIVQISADHAWYQIMIGRIVAGFGVGALSLLVPMYQSESAPPWIRGALVSTYQLFITLGIFLAACFNYGTVTHQGDNSASWRTVIGLGWLWTGILGFGILGFPETPRFDFRRGNVEAATKTLCGLYGAPPNHWAILTQLEEIDSKLKAETSALSPVKEFIAMFRAPRMLYRISIGILLQALQQLTGANYFFYYGTTVFKSVNIDSFITQIILNTINFVVTFLGLYMVEHFGRRKSLIAGAIWMFVCFMIFASVGHFALDRDDPTSTRSAGIAMIVFACFFILGFATTWGPMIWAIMSEIYPSRYRAKAMSLATASNWLWNFLLAFFTPMITGAIDFRYGYVFAGCNVAAAFVIYFFVIEGQGRTLEEIDTMYIEGVAPWKSASWVAPPAHEMANIRKQAGTELVGDANENEGTPRPAQGGVVLPEQQV